MRARAARMSLQGKSNRKIAEALGVRPNTVPNMLADSEEIKEFQRKLRRCVPKALENLEQDLSGQKSIGRQKATFFALEKTQVAVTKIEGDITQHEAKPIAEMTIEELDAAIAIEEQRIAVLTGAKPN